MQRKAKGSKAGPVGRRARRTFDAEFKAEAIRLMQERRATGVSVAQVARELDVRADQLRLWAKSAGATRVHVASVPGESLEQEVRRLRRENETLRQEQAFAKKATVVCRGRAGSLLAACRGLVHASRDDRAARRGRARDGRMATRTHDDTRPSFGSRLTIHE